MVLAKESIWSFGTNHSIVYIMVIDNFFIQYAGILIRQIFPNFQFSTFSLELLYSHLLFIDGYLIFCRPHFWRQSMSVIVTLGFFANDASVARQIENVFQIWSP